MPDLSPLDSYSSKYNSVESSLNAIKGRYDKSEAAVEDATKERGQVLEKTEQEQRGDQKQIAQFGKDNPYPHPDIKPWTEPTPKANPLQDFGSWASAFGIVAGMLTKTPLQNSLNASAAAIKAQQQGRWDQYDEAKKVWKENTEAAIKNAEWESKAYAAAWDLMKTDQAAGMAALQTALAHADNKVALAQLKQGNLKEVFEMTKTVGDMALQGPLKMLQMEALDETVQDKRIREDLYSKWLEGNGDKPPEEKAKMRSAIMSPAAAWMAMQNKWEVLRDPKTGTDYRFNPITGEATLLDGATPYKPQGAQRIPGGARSAPAIALQKLLEEKPDATADDITKFNADMQGQAKTVRDFSGSGTSAQRVTALNTAIDHIGTLKELATALDNGDIVAFNRIAQEWSKATGNPAPTNWDAARQIIGSEIVKGVVNSGGGVTDRAEAQESLDKALSPDQIDGSISTFYKLLGGQMKSLQRNYQTGSKEMNFGDKLSAAAKKAMSFKPDVKEYDADTAAAVPEFKDDKEAAAAFAKDPDKYKGVKKVKINGVEHDVNVKE